MEAKIIIAFLFKRSGREKLKESEIYLPLSLELGWFSTKESIAFVRHAIEHNLLKKEGEFLVPNFDVKEIKIPVGFFPSKVFELRVVDEVLKRIINKTKYKKQDILNRINEIESEKKVVKEVASLLYAVECNVDVKDLYDAVEGGILRANEV
jgi:hypothetical protein